MRGRPSCLLQSARGEANRILLASALRIICPNRVSRRDWIIAVSLGCFVSLHTSSFHTNWNALNLIISCCKSVAYHLWQYIYITATTTATVVAGTRVKKNSVFKDHLCDAVQDLLRGFPDRCYRLQRYREELRSFQQLRWDDAWNEIVRPLFDDS